MILNLACGDRAMPGAVNVDLRAGDLRADARALPFRASTFGQVHAQDVLEHFTAEAFQSVMAELRRVCLPAATLYARVPNLHAIAAKILDRPEHAAMWIRNIYGAHRWGPEGAWDAHHHGWTPELLKADLAANGWTVHRNDRAPNMTVTATLEGSDDA